MRTQLKSESKRLRMSRELFSDPDRHLVGVGWRMNDPRRVLGTLTGTLTPNMQPQPARGASDPHDQALRGWRHEIGSEPWGVGRSRLTKRRCAIRGHCTARPCASLKYAPTVATKRRSLPPQPADDGRPRKSPRRSRTDNGNHAGTAAPDERCNHQPCLRRTGCPFVD